MKNYKILWIKKDGRRQVKDLKYEEKEEERRVR
jgi:hypothetical protein